MKTTIVRQFGWDMGHRVPNHNSHCKNLHGHRYTLELYVTGSLIEDSGNSSEGMVLDFSDIKKLVSVFIDEKLDHSYMGYSAMDKDLLTICMKYNWKYNAVPFIPTAENIAKYIYDNLSVLIEQAKENKTFPMPNDLKISKVKLYETPNCFVEYEG